MATKNSESSINRNQFGSIINLTIDELNCCRSFHSGKSDPVYVVKRKFLHSARVHPMDNTDALCKRIGVKNGKIFQGWYKNDPDFKMAYDVIAQITKEYMEEVYEQHRSGK